MHLERRNRLKRRIACNAGSQHTCNAGSQRRPQRRIAMPDRNTTRNAGSQHGLQGTIASRRSLQHRNAT